jgi:quinol-cytochrome oxidoreductase complex cytochrome b subunit
MIYLVLFLIYAVASAAYLMHYDYRRVARVSLADVILSSAFGWLVAPFILWSEADEIIVFRKTDE